MSRYFQPTWWDSSRVPSTPVDYRMLRTSLERAVLKRMMVEVPFGVLLSGGLDSSLVASIAVRENLRSRSLHKWAPRGTRERILVLTHSVVTSRRTMDLWVWTRTANSILRPGRHSFKRSPSDYRTRLTRRLLWKSRSFWEQSITTLALQSRTASMLYRTSFSILKPTTLQLFELQLRCSC